jgi:AAA ATPase domain/Protein of unknown function (DUF3696)
MRVRWQNFRGYRDTGWLDLSPLTLLIGANNAGKTSLYSPLLLLKQTLEGARADTPLLTQGALFDAGRFRDFVSDHNLSNTVICSLDLGNLPGAPARERLSLSEKPRVLELSFSGDDLGIRTRLERYRLLNAQGHSVLRRQRLEDGTYGLDGPLLPSEKVVGRPPGPVSHLRSALRAERPEHFMFRGLAGLVRVGDLGGQGEHQERVEIWLNAGLRLLQIQNAVISEVTRQLSQISYVGPLRAMPRRTYRLSAEPPESVGTDGEFAPEMLFRDYTDGNGLFLEAVNHFLRSCGYGEVSFRADPVGDMFELLIGGDIGPTANLVDSGMGISQLLPLVTQSIFSREGSLDIVQQPEIHLNPALQVRLMDHLAQSVQNGRRVLIETHSEHLLLRLRRLIAQEDTDPASVSVIFADKIDGRSSVRQVKMSANGSIPRDEWPEGFFAEQLDDSLHMARAQARRARRTREDSQ